MAGRSSYIVNTPNQAFGNLSVAHKQATVTNSADSLPSLLTTGSLNANTNHVLVQVNGANIRVTFDGGATDPSATLGFRMVAGTEAYWSRDQFNNATVVREGSTDATLEIQEMNYRGT